MFFKIAILLICVLSVCNAQTDIQSIIQEAINLNKPEVYLPPGNIRVNNPISVYNAQNIKIRGSTRTKLIFTTAKSDRFYDIQIGKSNSVTLQDIEIDMDPLPFTQGRVSKVDFKWFEIIIHDGYPNDPSMFGEDSFIHVYDSNTRRFKQNGDISYVNRTEWISGGFRIFITGDTDYSNIQLDDLVSIGRPGFICSIALYDTRNTIIQNVSISAAQGCGVLENAGSGTVIDGVNIKRGPKPINSNQERLLSINRDGFHLNGPKGGTTIKNCFVEFCGDDAINIRSYFGRVTEVNNNIVNFAPLGLNFEKGSYLNVYDHKNYTLKKTVLVKKHEINEAWTEVESSFNIQENDLIVSPQHTQNFRIYNNQFYDIDARGIVATGSNIYIEKNIIERTTMGGIWIGAELTSKFKEGGFADFVYIRNNTVSEASNTLRGRRKTTTLLGAISITNQFEPGQQSNYRWTRPNRNIIIAENTVTRSSMASLFINSVWNVSICKNNLFYDNILNNNEAGHEFEINHRYSIVINDASTVKIFQNWVKPGPNTIDMRFVSESDTITDPTINPCV